MGLAMGFATGLVAAFLVGFCDVHPRAWKALSRLIVCVFATVLYLAGALSFCGSTVETGGDNGSPAPTQLSFSSIRISW